MNLITKNYNLTNNVKTKCRKPNYGFYRERGRGREREEGSRGVKQEVVKKRRKGVSCSDRNRQTPHGPDLRIKTWSNRCLVQIPITI